MIPIIRYSHYYWVGGPPKVSNSGKNGGSKAPGSPELVRFIKGLGCKVYRLYCPK